MIPAVQYVLLITSIAGIIAEITAMVFAEKLTAFVNKPEENMLPDKLVSFLGVLSLLYIIGVVVLLFSSDPVFRMYGGFLIILGMAGWLLRRLVGRTRILIMIDGTICLVILIDVLRTVVSSLFHM